MYSFNIVTTYVCTDEVHSDDHHHIIVTVVHICKWRDAIHTLHGFRLYRTLQPYQPALDLLPISGPQLAGLRSMSHAYQLYQRANDRAGWTAGFQPHRKRNSLLITRIRIKVPRGIVKHVLCSRVTGLALEVWRYCIYYKITIYQRPSNFSYTLPPL